MKITFQQSKSWWQSKDLDWFIENAEFAFTNKGYKGCRMRIVTNQKLNGRDCFEFDSDGYGIFITSESEYSNVWWNEMIVERSQDVTGMLIKFLYKWGAGEFVEPKPSLVSKINNYFSKEYKLITVEY